MPLRTIGRLWVIFDPIPNGKPIVITLTPSEKDEPSAKTDIPLAA
jgi:hypothetical protein